MTVTVTGTVTVTVTFTVTVIVTVIVTVTFTITVTTAVTLAVMVTRNSNLYCMQGEVQQLKQSNIVLSQRLALHEVEGPRSPQPRPPLKQMPVPSQTAARSEGCNPCAEAKLHEQASQLQLQGNQPFQEQLHTKLSKVCNWPLTAVASVPPWS